MSDDPKAKGWIQDCRNRLTHNWFLNKVLNRTSSALVIPGEILLEEFTRPMDLTLAAVSRSTGIHASRLTEITKCRRSITAETALRLAKFFGTTAGFWVGLKAEHDLETAGRGLGDRVDKEVTVLVR